MTTQQLTRTLGDERIAPFLPLISWVWEDHDPTDLDIAAICLAVVRTPGIDLTCKEALGAWLDPANPPSPRDLARLRAHLAARSNPSGGMPPEPDRHPRCPRSRDELPEDLIGCYFAG